MFELVMVWALVTTCQANRTFVNVGDNFGVPVTSVLRHAQDEKVSYREALQRIRIEHQATSRAAD